MTTLYLTEKPSVARDLARALGAHRRVGQRLEGPGVWVAWCTGHLVEIAEPHEHDARWRRWDPELLPMLPARLRLRPVARSRELFQAVRGFLHAPEVEEVINACDAGREGELIFRWVYELARCTLPVRRLWLSSLTPQAIRSALARLRSDAELRPLEAAARCRAEADWLVGMNATRGMTAAAGRRLLSVGRVQTPTLALVVRREEEIERFKPEPYWRVVVAVDPLPEGGRFSARWFDPRKKEHPDRIGTVEQAEALAEKLRDVPGRVSRVTNQRQEVPPPQLHHLTSLQQEANRRFGFSADRTLAAAQALYERHKLITYPRTDSRHLTRDVAATLPDVVGAVASAGPWAAAAAPLLEGALPPLGRRFVDDAEVGDHHAIIPTPTTPSLPALSRDEERVYELVVRQLLGAFFPPAVFARTRIELEGAGEHLLAEGRTRLEAGWEAVNPPHVRPVRPGEDQDEQPALPVVERGQAVHCAESQVQARTTRPPPRYTEASLLGAMERAGNTLDEAELRAAMREAGLGTPATRAATIETLLARGYLARDGRALVPLPPGRALIAALPVEALKSARLTGAWESRLQRIANGQEDPAPFRADIRRFVEEVVGAVRALPPLDLPPDPDDRGPARGGGARGGAGGVGARVRARSSGNETRGRGRGRDADDSAGAPVSGHGTVRRGRGTREGTANETGLEPSTFPTGEGTPPESRLGPSTFRAGERAPLETHLGEGTFPCTTQPRGRDTPPPGGGRARADDSAGSSSRPAGPACPSCGQGNVLRGKLAWGCSRWREGCSWTVDFVQDGVPIPPDEAARLFHRGATGLFARREGARARLVLDTSSPRGVRWELASRP